VAVEYHRVVVVFGGESASSDEDWTSRPILPIQMMCVSRPLAT